MTRQRRPSDQALKLLAAFLDAPKQWRHGYDLAEHTGLKSGTLYPILMRLEQRDLLQARWQIPEHGGAPRHQYRLTVAGLHWAREQLMQWEAGPAQPRGSRA